LSAKFDTPNIYLQESTDSVYINGIVNIRETDGSGSYAVPNGKMKKGSLTIGSTEEDYGQTSSGGNWTSNAAGLLLECSTYTSIAVHDGGTRLANFMYYSGPTNTFIIGNDAGWGRSNCSIGGGLSVNNPSAPWGTLNLGDAIETDKNTYIYIYMLKYWWCWCYNTIWLGSIDWQGFGFYNQNNSTYTSHISVNKSAPSNAFFIYASGNLRFYQNSDRRFKRNIEPIQNALEKINNLTGISYTHLFEGDKRLGLIAQDVEEVIPEVVKYSEKTDLYTIDYISLIPVLINSIKELNNIVNNQNQQIKELQEKIIKINI